MAWQWRERGRKRKRRARSGHPAAHSGCWLRPRFERLELRRLLTLLSTTPNINYSVGVNYPVALAISSSGKLYVANEGNNTVSEYAPGSSMPIATFTGLYDPRSIAFDSGGDLYVATYNGTVVEYPPQST